MSMLLKVLGHQIFKVMRDGLQRNYMIDNLRLVFQLVPPTFPPFMDLTTVNSKLNNPKYFFKKSKMLRFPI